MACGICGRKLDEEDDPLSVDCGGDCWDCIGEIEAEMGDEYSLAKVREKFAKGLRPSYVDESAEISAEIKKQSDGHRPGTDIERGLHGKLG